jgi:alpha-glucosidase
LFRVDRQFLIGRDILVTPVLSKGATSVTGFLPGHEQTVWRDWYTHRAMKPDEDTGTATFPAPLGHINVHIRDGAAILLHQKPGYTTTETAEGPYELLVSLTAEGYAHGHAYIDDGIIYPANLSRTYKFFAHKGKLTITSKGEFRVSPKLEKITILGVITKPTKVNIDGQAVSFEYDITIQQVELEKTGIDLNKPVGIEWY